MRHPPHAHVPGQTPRHPEGAFDVIRDTARPGMSAAALAGSDAWATGLRFLDEGFFWEAHELLEPVWMACPDASAEREMAQCLIQVANAALKARMGRPRAVARILGLAEAHLARAEALGAGAPVLAQAPEGIRTRLAELRAISAL